LKWDIHVSRYWIATWHLTFLQAGPDKHGLLLEFPFRVCNSHGWSNRITRFLQDLSPQSLFSCATLGGLQQPRRSKRTTCWWTCNIDLCFTWYLGCHVLLIVLCRTLIAMTRWSLRCFRLRVYIMRIICGNFCCFY